jgi:EpsI family protein
MAGAARTAAVQIDAHASPVLAPTKLPLAIGEWVQSARRPWAWTPASLPAELQLAATFQRGDLDVTLDVWHYVDQHQDAEAVSSRNLVVAAKDAAWRVVARGTQRVATADGDLTVESYRLSGPRPIAVWRWYRVGSRYTASPYLAKLYEALYRLRMGRTDGAVIVVAAPLDARGQPPVDALQDFVRQMLPELSGALDASVGER